MLESPGEIQKFLINRPSRKAVATEAVDYGTLRKKEYLGLKPTNLSLYI